MGFFKDLIVAGTARIVGKLYVNGGIVGNLTGNVTGNVSGSSGSCTGNAATATNASKVNNLTVQTAVPANAKFTDTTYSAATQSAQGLMSANDKKKLDGIATGATAVTSSTVSGWGFLKNIKVGGRNLFMGSRNFDPMYWNTDASGASAKGTVVMQADGSMLITNNGSNFRIYPRLIDYCAPAKKGMTFTVSVKIKNVSNLSTFNFQIEELSGNNVVFNAPYTLPDSMQLADGWTLYYFRYTMINDYATSLRVWLRSGEDYATYTHQYYIKEPMLECSNVPSDYSAPEDNYIQVGGENLFEGTAIPKTVTTNGGFVTYRFSVTNLNKMGLKVGDYLTLSFKWKVNGTANSNSAIEPQTYFGPWTYGTVVSAIGTNGPTSHIITPTSNGSGKAVIVFQVTQAVATGDCESGWWKFDRFPETSQVTISEAMLEKANTASTWRPALQEQIKATKLYCC